MAQAVVDLAVELRGQQGQYTVEFRLSRGIDSTLHAGPFSLALEPERLRSLLDQPNAYAALLTDMLFGAAEIREVLATARGMARAQQAALRFRLQPGPGAEALHALRWEALNLPGQNERISTREDVYFSRYIAAGADAYLPQPFGQLRALAAVAAPLDLDRYNLPAIDPAAETKRAAAGLNGLKIDWLTGGRGGPDHSAARCTLASLVEQIPSHDVLYLVCHGMMALDTGWLLLEDDSGKAERVSVETLTRHLAGAAALPRLGLLVVCESANGSQAMSALAPRLVRAGIPAVIGMQGSLTYPTADVFLPVVFRELREDGIIDRAVAVARRAILDRPDEAAPVLLMSLISGRLWAEPPQSVPVQVAAAVTTPEPSPKHNNAAVSAPDPVQFYHLLNSDSFTMEDLEQLCFELGVDWETIRGQTKPAKARAMIQYFQGRGRLAELYAAVLRARPHLG